MSSRCTVEQYRINLTHNCEKDNKKTKNMKARNAFGERLKKKRKNKNTMIEMKKRK
jgi:hypothetical protein